MSRELTENTTTRYYEKIDGLRFVAICLVLIEHFMVIVGRHISAGFYGVDLFFVISGFLITSILLKPNKKSFKENYINFLGRRTLRIFPIYYFTILILWLLNIEVIRTNLIWFVTYTYNYAETIYKLPVSPVMHFWSLCVEEQFYLIWPFIVLSLKDNLKLLTLVIVLIVIIGYSQSIFNVIPSLTSFNKRGLLTRMASLGLGALGSVLMIRQKLPDKILKSRIAEGLLFSALIFSLLFTFKLKIFFLGLCSLYLVLKAANYDFNIFYVNCFLQNRYIIRIGTLAYGIYIFHLPIAYFFSKYLINDAWISFDFKSLGRFSKLRWHSWVLKFPLYTILSVLLASLSYNYIEMPFLKLKDRLFRL